MQFGWHPAKSEATFRERGFDFDYATRIFQHSVKPLEEQWRGEARSKVMGEVEGRVLVVVFTMRGDVCWIISAPPCQPKGAPTMAVVRRTLEEIRRNPGRIDRAKFDATTEADIRRYMIEDGENPDAPSSRDLPGYVLPEAVRANLGMTQTEFAAAIRVPVATLRNWEQGRRHLDPAARSLLLLVWANPKAALRALSGKRPAVRQRVAKRRVVS